MAFADPLPDVTLATVAQVLPRISQDGTKSVYQKNDQVLTVTISHQEKKESGKSRVGTRVHFEQKAVVPDPLTSINDYEFLRVTFLIDRPLAGFTSIQVNDLVAAVKGYLTTTNVGKLFGRES